MLERCWYRVGDLWLSKHEAQLRRAKDVQHCAVLLAIRTGLMFCFVLFFQSSPSAHCRTMCFIASSHPPCPRQHLQWSLVGRQRPSCLFGCGLVHLLCQRSTRLQVGLLWQGQCPFYSSFLLAALSSSPPVILQTLVYAFTKPDRVEQCVVFWNTKTNEKYIKLSALDSLWFPCAFFLPLCIGLTHASIAIQHKDTSRS